MNREAEIAWAAGLYEGEGCVIWAANTAGCRFARIQLTMTDRDAVERFSWVCGSQRRVTARKRRLHYKTIHCCEISIQDDVYRILNMFLPYLCERRRADARQVITAIEHRRESNGRKVLKHPPRTEDQRRRTRLATNRWRAKKRNKES